MAITQTKSDKDNADFNIFVAKIPATPGSGAVVTNIGWLAANRSDATEKVFEENSDYFIVAFPLIEWNAAWWGAPTGYINTQADRAAVYQRLPVKVLYCRQNGYMREQHNGNRWEQCKEPLIFPPDYGYDYKALAMLVFEPLKELDLLVDNCSFNLAELFNIALEEPFYLNDTAVLDTLRRSEVDTTRIGQWTLHYRQTNGKTQTLYYSPELTLEAFPNPLEAQRLLFDRWICARITELLAYRHVTLSAISFNGH